MNESKGGATAREIPAEAEIEAARTQADAGWNPRFLLYCRAIGEPDPERALERDRERYPGGHMAGFLAWSGQPRGVGAKVTPV